MQVRDAAERDIPEILIAYQDDPELHLRLGEERPPSGAELGRRADAESEVRAAGLRATLTIVAPGRDVCQGQIHVREVDWEHRRGSLAIWLAPHARGRGLGSAALRLVASWLLARTELVRLQILADPDDASVIRAARAAGFVPEGVLRGHQRRRGRRIDVAVLSLLSTDVEPMSRYWRVKLPQGVRTPFEVYVNGVRQELGADYHVSRGELLFEKELVTGKLGLRAWLLGFWGIGTYKRNDEVDVSYELDGRPMVAHALAIIPPESGPPPA